MSLKEFVRTIDEVMVRCVVVATFGAAGFMAGMLWWSASPQPTWATVAWVVGGFAAVGMVVQGMIPSSAFRDNNSDKKED